VDLDGGFVLSGFEVGLPRPDLSSVGAQRQDDLLGNGKLS
jgi:hypothetical protein